MAARQSNRAFGLTVAGILGIFAGLFWWMRGAVPVALAVASGALLMMAAVAPGILLPLNRLWAQLAQRFGHLTNYLLLGFFFYAFVLPTGLVLRMLGRDPMKRRFAPDAPSYLTPVQRGDSAETLPDQF